MGLFIRLQFLFMSKSGFWEGYSCRKIWSIVQGERETHAGIFISGTEKCQRFCLLGFWLRFFIPTGDRALLLLQAIGEKTKPSGELTASRRLSRFLFTNATLA